MKTLTVLSFVAGICAASAQTWTVTSAPTNYWAGIAASADGSKVIAAVGGVFTFQPGPIYVSTNYGGDWWQTSAPSNSWAAVAASADGATLLAAASVGSTPGPIYSSRDGGMTWVSNNVAPHIWRFVACSADGATMFAGYGGRLFRSSNYGADWVSNSVPGWCLGCSADAVKLTAASESGPVYTSTDSGATWATNTFLYGAWTLAAAADGNTVVNASDHGHVYLSRDSGVTWAASTVPPCSWQYVAVSADASNILVAGWQSSGKTTGPIYTSTDSGQTWVSNNVPYQQWMGVACSADGNALFAVSAATGLLPNQHGQGSIWRAIMTPAPELEIAAADTNVVVSWIVPSRPYALVEATSLNPTNWIPVSEQPVLDCTSLKYRTTCPATGGSSFYRLTSR